MQQTDLSIFNNSNYNPGNKLKILVWYIILNVFFMNRLFPFMAPKQWLLRIFGAQVGQGLIIKPNVNIKYPWNLIIGDHVWIGENVWIDNLDKVTIGSHCCISQGALILSGNHHYKKTTFDLVTLPIVIKEGVWIGARATVVQGITCKSHSILSVASVATSDLEEYTIYQGVPAVKVRERVVDKK
jgi:putative colanic acid biosynthesis acetyltransferase WcaF